MNTERDKYLTEAMGLCFHPRRRKVESFGGFVWVCRTCHRTNPIRINFDSPDGFFKLWNWAQGQEWWVEFIREHYTYTANTRSWELVDSLVHPTRFADAVYDYLRANEKNLN
jgi:hypothetical protein